jgi:hypothetical protein
MIDRQAGNPGTFRFALSQAGIAANQTTTKNAGKNFAVELLLI